MNIKNIGLIVFAIVALAAVFSFIFLYLNTVAFLAKRAGELVFSQDSSRLLFYTRAAANYFGKFRKKNIG